MNLSFYPLQLFIITFLQQVCLYKHVSYRFLLWLMSCQWHVEILKRRSRFYVLCIRSHYAQVSFAQQLATYHVNFYLNCRDTKDTSLDNSATHH